MSDGLIWTVTHPDPGDWAPPGWCCTLRLLSAERLDRRWHSNNSAGKWKSSLLRAKKGNYSPMPKKSVFCLQFMLPVMTQTGISDRMIHKSSQEVFFHFIYVFSNSSASDWALASKTSGVHNKSARITAIWKILKKIHKTPRPLLSEVFFVLFFLLKNATQWFLTSCAESTSKNNQKRHVFILIRGGLIYVKNL